MSEVYGLQAGDIKARPDFVARRGENGLWSGSVTLTCQRDVWEGGASSSFKRGEPITSVYLELSNYWSFLAISDAEVEFLPGALVVIRCTLEGYNSGEFQATDSSFDVYTLAGTTTELPIESHPLFIAEILRETDTDVVEQRPYLLGALNGEWLEAPPNTNINTATEIPVYRVSDGRRALIDNSTVFQWWTTIFREGHRTWDGPTSEWTLSQTRGTNFTDDELSKLGFVDIDVPGDPPTPFDGHYDWKKVGMDSSNTADAFELEQTWQLSPPGGWHWLYKYELFDVEKTDTRNN